MEVYKYDHATLMIGGKPLTGTNAIFIENEAPSPPVVSKDWSVSATFTTSAVDFFESVKAIAPAPIDVVFGLGILGPIRFPAWADDLRLRGDSNGTTATVELTPDGPSFRRAVSIAVQRAICERAKRVGVITRAAILGSDELAKQARDVLRRKGERKQRRAMRRTIRAANVLRAT